MNIEDFLMKLGYFNKCPECGKKTLSKARLIMDIVFIVAWVVVLYFYFTSELPYIQHVKNCTSYCYEIMGNPLGTTSTSINPFG